MFARLGCLFVVIPLLELALLIWIGQWMGVLPTVLLVAVTGIVGAWLARSQGIQVLTRVQMQMAGGELPGRALMDAAAILVGGTLLMTPGVLTDVIGFALLLPPTRSVLQKWATARLMRGMQSGRIHVTMMGGRPGPDAGPGAREPGRSNPVSDGGADRGGVGGARGGRDGGGARDPDDGDARPPRPGEIIQ